MIYLSLLPFPCKALAFDNNILKIFLRIYLFPFIPIILELLYSRFARRNFFVLELTYFQKWYINNYFEFTILYPTVYACVNNKLKYLYI